MLELSFREALQLGASGDDVVAPEHILLGFIREGEGVGCQILVKLGVDLSSLRRNVIRKEAGIKGEDEVDVPAPGQTPTEPQPDEAESLYGRIRQVQRLLSELAGAHSLELAGKDERIAELVAALAQSDETIVELRDVIARYERTFGKFYEGSASIPLARQERIGRRPGQLKRGSPLAAIPSPRT